MNYIHRFPIGTTVKNRMFAQALQCPPEYMGKVMAESDHPVSGGRVRSGNETWQAHGCLVRYPDGTSQWESAADLVEVSAAQAPSEPLPTSLIDCPNQKQADSLGRVRLTMVEGRIVIVLPPVPKTDEIAEVIGRVIAALETAGLAAQKDE